MRAADDRRDGAGGGRGGLRGLRGLVRVAQAIYTDIIRREITVATVNRDPQEIALDLRKYVQHPVLLRAKHAFAQRYAPSCRCLPRPFLLGTRHRASTLSRHRLPAGDRLWRASRVGRRLES
jgi:hypothetical protein